MNKIDSTFFRKSDRVPKESTLISNLLFPADNRAVVTVEIGPEQLGRIYYQDTYWFGCGLDNVCIPQGTVVELLERRGNTWLVKPINCQLKA